MASSHHSVKCRYYMSQKTRTFSQFPPFISIHPLFEFKFYSLLGDPKDTLFLFLFRYKRLNIHAVLVKVFLEVGKGWLDACNFLKERKRTESQNSNSQKPSIYPVSRFFFHSLPCAFAMASNCDCDPYSLFIKKYSGSSLGNLIRLSHFSVEKHQKDFLSQSVQKL